MKEEIFPLVDETGNIIGSATRNRCHDGSKLLHPVVHLHIFDSQGKLFMQKRSITKDIQPGLWDTSSAGHIDLGETPEIAVKREAKEELGVEILSPVFIMKYIIENELEKELTYCYFTVYDGPISIDNDEVSDGRFWTMDEIKSSLRKGIFTFNFEKDYTQFLSMGLDELQKIYL